MMSVMEKETYAPKHDGIAITTMHQHYGLSTSLRSAGMVGSVLYCLSCVQPVQAAPVGGVVVGGEAQISRTGGDVTIHQGTDRAAIDWERFDIDTGETTRFIQPSASSAALNRVTGSTDASRIAGNLQSNGHVVLLNPNGVVFERGSRVDVGGLIASSADTDAARFMQGGTLKLDRPGNPNAVIINHGDITARDAGLVGMVAPNVENHGAIRAKLGKVALAAGDTAEIDLYGDGLISVQASDAVTKQLVRNTGSIDAAGGEILLTAAHGRQLIDNLVRVSGELRAPSVTQQGGRIIISGERATVDVSARMDASGEQVAGRVLIGGTYQGRDESIPNAAHTILHKPAIITANATNGKGGEVIVWADDTADVNGTIEAKGANTTQGGFVETSGKQTLLLREDINVNTNGGTWLIDPQDITIDATLGGNIITGLGSNHVVVHTNNGSAAGTGNITLNQDLEYNSIYALSLLAHDNIRLNRHIQNEGSGAINIVAGWNGSTGFTPDATPGTVDSGNPFMDANNANGILNLANNAYGNRNGSVFVNSTVNNNNTWIGSATGTTTVVGYNVTLQGGNTARDQAIIGYHRDTGANYTGDITVQAVNDINIRAGNTSSNLIRFGSYAAIGHGRYDYNANYSGDITIKTRNLTMQSASGAGSYAAIGHGAKAGAAGETSTGTASGNITIDVTNDATLTASSTSTAYFDNGVMIGHGDDDGQNFGNRSGNIVTRIGGELSLIDNDPNDSIVLYHRANSAHTSTGDTRISANALDFSAATTGAFDLNNALFAGNMIAGLAGGDVTIGSTGTADMVISSDIITTDADNTSGNLTLLSQENIRINAHIVNAEADRVADGSNTEGLINVVAGWDGSTGFDDTADTTFDMSAITGNSATYGNNSKSVFINNATGTQGVAVGSRDGATSIAGYDVILQGGNSNIRYAHIGTKIDGASQRATGDINVHAIHNVHALGGASNNSYAMIGHGGDGCVNVCSSFASTVLGGNITIENSGSTLLTGSTSPFFRSFVQIGHGGRQVMGEKSGMISLRTTGDIIATPGQESYTQIGHGGLQTRGNVTGDIEVQGQNITLDSNTGVLGFSYSQIGHGSVSNIISGNTRQGDITVVATGELSFTKSTTVDSEGYIGHNTSLAGGISGNTLILAGALDFDAATTGTFDINNADFIASINRNLAGGAVTIGSTGANGLAWNTALTTASANTLSLLSARDLTLNTDITHNTAGATLNAVAGWNGTTGLNADGTINTATIRSSGVTNAGSLLHTGGTLTAPTIYLDANNSLQGVVNTTALDIGVSSNNASLTGLVAAGADQAAANMITGGPGNHADYRFENFIIRFLPASTSTGTVATPLTPTVMQTPVTPIPEVVPIVLTTPQPEIVNPEIAAILPVRNIVDTSIIPNTVEVNAQTPVPPILRDGIGLNDSPTRTNTTPFESSNMSQAKKDSSNADDTDVTADADESKPLMKKRSILKVHPALKSLFNIKQDLL